MSAKKETTKDKIINISNLKLGFKNLPFHLIQIEVQCIQNCFKAFLSQKAEIGKTLNI